MADDNPDQSEHLSRSASAATIASYKINRWILTFTAVGVAVGIAVAFASCGGSDPGGGQSAQAPGPGINVNQNQPSAGSCGQIGDNNTCTVELQESVSELGKNAPTDDEFKAELAKKSTSPPTEPVPWPFVVVDTGNLGLFARSTNRAVADRVGLTLNRNVIWVDCVATSDFVPPDIKNDVGPEWLQVRWKNDQKSVHAMQSDPTDTKRAWMYRGYTVPLYHNGDIPRCPA